MTKKKNTILVCDDDKEIVEAIDIYLSQEGYHILKAYDGVEALNILEKEKVNLLILDVMMPKLDGIRATLKIRETNSVPIIILSAKSEDSDKILGLNIGADDYVTKPFKLGELCSRIRALLRRAGVSNVEKSVSIECGDITIDLLGNRVSMKDRILDLTSAEYRLLCLLVRNANRVITRDIILNELWDDTGNFVDDNTLSVYVRRLREKVEADPSHPEHLITVRGFGYQWKEVSV